MARVAGHTYEEQAEEATQVSVPSPWVALLLALAAFRVFRFIARDTLLDGPRARVLRLAGWDGETDPPPGYRGKLDKFILCPWCAGFHIGVLWWAAWLVFPTVTAALAVPWAINAVVALVEKNLDE